MLDLQKTFYSNFPNAVERMPHFMTNFIVKMLQIFFHENTFNKIYKKNYYLKGLEFVDSMLGYLNIVYSVRPNELKNLPSTGRLIVVANHVTGASDAFALAQLMGTHRENKKVKCIVNSLLTGITQAQDIIIPVDNITGKITKETIKAIDNALENEEVIIIFPAGIVNRWSINGIKDTPWKASFLKIARKHHTPILPIHIKASNSLLFYYFSLFLPNKITGFMLPREFATTKKRRPLNFRIGEVIPYTSFMDKDITTKEYVKMFYKHLYTIGTNKKNILQTEVTINSGNNKILLRNEVQASQYLGHTQDGSLIILANAHESPLLIQELGRIREVSFRAVGGGTGTAKDNDLYDDYYKHLILWNETDLDIVGAYRIGELHSLVQDKGMNALYTYKQCIFSDEFKKYLDYTVELGRSFVQPKYWGTRALDNLWQGVGAYLTSNPHITHTSGIVTIPADTSPKGVAALVYFYSYHFSSSKDNMITAKSPYILSPEDKIEFDLLFKNKTYKEGMVTLKQYMKKHNSSVPTLFKQYVELYEMGAVRFFDFMVNEELHGIVEAFILTDNTKMKKEKKMRYFKTHTESLLEEVA